MPKFQPGHSTPMSTGLLALAEKYKMSERS